MGESKEGVLRLDIDRRPKLEFPSFKVTSDICPAIVRGILYAAGARGPIKLPRWPEQAGTANVRSLE